MDGALTTTADVAKQLDFGGGDTGGVAPVAPPAASPPPLDPCLPPECSGPLVLPEEADLSVMGAPSVDAFRR